MGVSYTRLLKKDMSGDDVRYMKECLFKLKMYPSKITKINNSTFGADTLSAVKSYQKSHRDINGAKLTVDGIIGRKSWEAIVRDYEALFRPAVSYTRLLKKGMSGEDVRYVQTMLHSLKYLTKGKNPTDGVFGNNTLNAVKAFQRARKLTVDGIVGRNTWGSLEKAMGIGSNPSTPAPTPSKPVYLTVNSHPNLTEKTISALNDAWQGVSSTRIALMKMCVSQAYDTVNGSYKSGDCPQCLYIIGADLYDKSLNLFKPTVNYINRRAKAMPGYFTGGRKDWMISQLSKRPGICATDCSGMIVGALRVLKLVANSFDTTANNFSKGYHSSIISKSSLKPGDWVWRTGHIGVYLGAGLVVEAAGGAYGVQITKLDERKCRNLMNGNLETMSAWAGYRRPKYY